jgi:hypothetical protein
LKRILFISLTIVVLVAFLAFPASAEMLDYTNHIDSIYVSGQNDIVSLRFRDSGVWFAKGDSYFYPESIRFDFSNSPMQIIYDPFRHKDGTQDYLLRSDFPNSTPFELSFMALGINDISSAVVHIYQLDESHNVVSQLDLPVQLEIIGGSSPEEVQYRAFTPSNLTFVESCYCFTLFYEFTVLGDGGQPYSYKLYGPEFVFTFTINSLLRQQMLANRTNNILGAVEDQLAENGQKLDDIINGSVSSTPPSGSGSVGDLDDIEGALRDESQAGLDQGLGMQQSALDVFVQYAAAFGVVKLIFELFSGIPFFTYILYISVAVGIFSVLLNLSFDVRNSFNRKNRRSRSGS